VTFEVLTAVDMKVRPTAFWNVMPCSVVECNLFLVEFFLYQISIVMMETGG